MENSLNYVKKMIDRAFSETIKILFKEDIVEGNIEDYKEWLNKNREQIKEINDKETGEKIRIGAFYPEQGIYKLIENTKFNKEVNIDINNIKDIDSIIESLKEEFNYIGERQLGRTHLIEKSDNCKDSMIVKESYDITKGEYIAFSDSIRESKYIFGCSWCGETEFSITSQAVFMSKRVVESYLTLNSSDVYYSFNCNGCNEVMFSYNQINKFYVIGNLELSKEKYYKIKEKLLEDLREELKKRRAIPSLFEIAEGKNEGN